MADVELERMLVRLDGDARGYTRMLAEAQSAAVGAAAAIGAALTFRGALDAFTGAETIGVRLNAVLTSNGRDVEGLTARYRNFAAEMARTTTVSQSQVLQMLTTAETFGLSGRAAQEAVHHAEALASITGQEAEHLLRFTAALAKGDLETAMRFKRMIPQLKDARNETELLEKANHMFETGMATSQAMANTLAGQMTRLHNNFAGLTREIGAFVAQAVRPVVEGLMDAVNWFRGLDDGVKRNVTIMAGALAGFLALGPALKLVGVLGFTVFNPMIAVVGALGFALSVFVERAGGIPQAIGQARESLAGFAQANLEVIRTVGIAGLVLAGLVLAFKLLQVSGVIAVAQWALHTVAVVVWTGVTIAAKVALLALSLAVSAAGAALTLVQGTFTALAFAINFLAGAGTILTGVLTTLAGVLATVSVGTITALAMMPAILLAIGTIGYAAFTNAGTAAAGLFGAVRGGANEVASAFRSMTVPPEIYQALASLKALFGEWGSVIRDAATAMTISFDLAWRFVAVGGQQAMRQIQMFWPPVVRFIRESFSELWTFVSNSFYENIVAAAGYAREYMAASLTGREMDSLVTDSIDRRLRQQLAVHTGAFTDNMNVLAGDLGRSMGAAASQGLAEMQVAFDPLRNELQEAIDYAELVAAHMDQDARLAAAGDDAANAFKGAADKVRDTKDAINELKASAVGSVDAAAKIAAYLSGATEGNAGPTGAAVRPPRPAAAAAASPTETARAVIDTSRAFVGDRATALGAGVALDVLNPSAAIARGPSEGTTLLLNRALRYLQTIAENGGVTLAPEGGG